MSLIIKSHAMHFTFCKNIRLAHGTGMLGEGHLVKVTLTSLLVVFSSVLCPDRIINMNSYCIYNNLFSNHCICLFLEERVQMFIVCLFHPRILIHVLMVLICSSVRDKSRSLLVALDLGRSATRTLPPSETLHLLLQCCT